MVGRPRPRRPRRLSAGARPPRGGARAHPHRHHPDGRGVAAHHAERALKSYHWAFLAQPHPAARDADRQGPGLLPRAHAEELGRPARPLAVLGRGAGALPRAAAGARRACTPCARTIAPAPASTGSSTRPTSPPAARSPARRSCSGRSDYLGRGGANPLEVWQALVHERRRAPRSKSGHFLAEENPKDTLAALLPFLQRRRGARTMRVSSRPRASPRAGTQGAMATLAAGSRIFAAANSGMTAREHDAMKPDRQSPAGAQADAAGRAAHRSRWRWAAAARAGSPTS